MHCLRKNREGDEVVLWLLSFTRRLREKACGIRGGVCARNDGYEVQRVQREEGYREMIAESGKEVKRRERGSGKEREEWKERGEGGEGRVDEKRKEREKKNKKIKK